MPARAIGSGTIAFGLVSIPCKLFTSASPGSVFHFNQLHRECGSRVRQKLYCPTHDKLLERDEIVKGYEFAKGRYVVFADDELDAIEQAAGGDIDIAEFVPLVDVDPVYFDRAYYLGPDKGASRAYHLLAQALRETGLAAIATYAARGKQYLVLLRPVADGLVMQQLHYAHEIRPFSDVGVDTATVKPDELELAIQLIRQGAHTGFHPDRYHDEVRGRIEALIERKVAGEDITAVPRESPKAQVIDLMAALKASLAVGGTEPDEARVGPKRSSASDVDKSGRKRSKKKRAARG